MKLEIVNTRNVVKGALAGFFDLQAGPFLITECSAFQKDGRIWFNFPSKKMKIKDEEKWVQLIRMSKEDKTLLEEKLQPQLKELFPISPLAKLSKESVADLENDIPF